MLRQHNEIKQQFHYEISLFLKTLVKLKSIQKSNYNVDDTLLNSLYLVNLNVKIYVQVVVLF